MDDTIAQLLDAHVQHELNRFKRGGHKKTIKEEVTAIFEWSKKFKLKDVITPKQIIGVIERNVVDMPVAGGITELIGEMSQRVLASPQNKKTTLEDIFDRKQYDDIIDKIGSLTSARRDIINRFVNSSVYSEQISEVLFTGIKDYLLSDNIIAKKVPGISSLIKVGKLAVNKTMHSLEVAIESKVKEFIESNLSNTIKRSEKSLNESFDEASLIEMGDKIWSSVARTKLSGYFKAIDANDMEDFIIIGYDFWNHFRKTEYYKAIYTDLVHFFFEKYSNRGLDAILNDVGVTKQMVINELNEMIEPGIKKSITTGYLEERIRARLEDFYLSPKTSKFLESKKETKKASPQKSEKNKPVKNKTLKKKPAKKKKPS